MSTYTTTDLLNDIKSKLFVPVSQSTFTDAELISLANGEYRTRLIPLIMRAREGFYLTSQDVLITQVAQAIKIPPRAIGNGLNDIFNVIGSQVFNVPYLPLHQQVTSFLPAPKSVYYYTQNDSIILYSPTQVTPTGSIRMFYYQRPGDLVLTTGAMQVTSIDVPTNTVTVSLVPSTFLVGTLCDFQQQGSPFSFLAIDQAITAIVGNQVTYASLPTDLVVGDWVTMANESVVPQAPQEFFQLLSQYAVSTIATSLGDAAAIAQAEEAIPRMEKALLGVINPRVENTPKKVITNTGPLIGTRQWPRY